MLSDSELLKQSFDTAHDAMRHAIQDIDKLFGESGFAKKNPALVAAYMRTSASDFACMFGVQKLDNALGRLADALDK